MNLLGAYEIITRRGRMGAKAFCFIGEKDTHQRGRWRSWVRLRNAAAVVIKVDEVSERWNRRGP